MIVALKKERINPEGVSWFVNRSCHPFGILVWL